MQCREWIRGTWCVQFLINSSSINNQPFRSRERELRNVKLPSAPQCARLLLVNCIWQVKLEVFPETRVGFPAVSALPVQLLLFTTTYSKISWKSIRRFTTTSCTERHEATAINVQLGCTHTLVNLKKSLVIQHPYNMDSTASKTCKGQRKYIKKLCRITPGIRQLKAPWGRWEGNKIPSNTRLWQR